MIMILLGNLVRGTISLGDLVNDLRREVDYRDS